MMAHFVVALIKLKSCETEKVQSFVSDILPRVTTALDAESFERKHCDVPDSLIYSRAQTGTVEISSKIFPVRKYFEILITHLQTRRAGTTVTRLS